MVQGLSVSERRACRYAGLSRTSYREPLSMNQSTASLSTRIVELAHERRRFGYRRIHDLLSLEGHQVNHKRVWRLYKLANLSVRKRRKVKRPTGERQPLAASQHVNDTWSADFVMDALANGRRIKCLTLQPRVCGHRGGPRHGWRVRRALAGPGSAVPRLPAGHPHRSGA